MTGEGVAIWLDPTTGQLMVNQDLYVGFLVMVWMVCVVLGLQTARLVLP